MDGNNGGPKASQAPLPLPLPLQSAVSMSPVPAASVTSSTVTPQSGYSRASYRREAVGWRSYSSVQDFSSYRTYPATSLEASPYQDSADSLEKSLPVYHISRGGSLPFRLPKSGGGVAKGGGGGGSTATVLSPLVVPQVSGAQWCSRGYLLVLLSLLLFVGLFLAYRWSDYGLHREQLQFAVVVDCGSTGTRIHVYGWARSSTRGRDSLPVMLRPEAHEDQQRQGRAYKRMETEPGLHKLLHNETGVRAALEPLLDWAGKRIPAWAHGSTPVFVLATAGLRRLPPADSKWVLDRVWSVLESSSFLCRRSWVRIISGVEEASYGWIALNYNQDRLGQSSGLPTFGALDLGGSSLEVTFEPGETPQAKYGVNLSVGTVEHQLYAYSHEGFGLNDAFQNSVATLLRRNKPEILSSQQGPIELKHPCLHAGYRQAYVSSMKNPFPGGGPSGFDAAAGKMQVELVGDPNWEACADLAMHVLQFPGLAEPPSPCDATPCALGKHQPHPNGKFFALSGFFVVYKFFGLQSDASLEELLRKAQQYCVVPWEEARSRVEPQPSIEQYCFRAPYVVALLRSGLNLSDNQIVIDSGGFAWTLGAALLEAGALASSSEMDSRSLEGPLAVPFILDTITMKGLLFIVAMLAVLVLLCVSICSRRWIMWQWRRSYLPMFMHSPNSQSGCLPKAFGSIFSPSPTGEGRVKLPGSPLPVTSIPPYQQDHLGLSSENSLDSDMLQKSDAAGSTSTATSVGRPRYASHKRDGSCLQSRRTQSREDLNLYDLDSHLNKV